MTTHNDEKRGTLDLDRKPSIEMIEDAEGELKKPIDDVATEVIEVSEEDNARLLRKIDKRVLPILIWCYLLQILDKFVFGYGNVYGMSTSLNLHGTQYSLASTMNNVAQAAWMPFSTYLIVKVPARILMPALIVGWGTAQACMGASQNLSGLAAARFFLGLFEAGCVPLFSIMTAHWYRRSEQPIRVAAWYSTVGLGQIVAAVISFGFGKIHSDKLESWRIIFIVVGSTTVLSAPIVYYFLEADIEKSRFLNQEEKKMAIERVRANQTGTGTREFKWPHIWEVCYDPKTYLFGGLSLCVNFGATVATAFGPTLLKDMGFTKETASLLNAPFGALQFLTIWLGSYLTQRFKQKGIILAAMMTPVLIGVALLYQANTQPQRQLHMALGGYYCLSFIWSGNPIIVSWMVANTAGQTKKSAILNAFNGFNAIGSIAGPLLFNSRDSPRYIPGLRATLGVFSAMMGCIILCFIALFLLNTQRERQRIAVGKPAKIRDTSMLNKYEAYSHEEGLGENALKDLTDFKNNEFTYVY
ncbi:uncharacterized protein L201_000031 [Kwoniella dendrophila CBS 6074]|uniref:Major facilitator superfamily (MFS) profile domain-containing protein n=1 Tax=Kwoniella dendrophila CBS 6074 TaxID=1295534 RepID=A0AAX4JJW2_9TREE